jgi:AraC-like DNA-binding protein
MTSETSRILASLNDAPLHEVFGLACGLSTVPAMTRAHRHDDVEVVVSLGGGARLELSGSRHSLDHHDAAFFWAGHPHRIADNDDGVEVAWLTVPLVDVLAWDLPAAFVARLLRGDVSLMPAPIQLVDAMALWQQQVGGAPDLTRAVRLEAQAWLLRAAEFAHASAPSRPRNAATVMASYVSQNFRDPLRVADVAAVAHVHPSTAAEVFRRSLGVTIGEYLAQCRVAEAQRLLISTDATTTDVAARAGFGSTSRFYARFVQDCGMSPGAYRAAMT